MIVALILLFCALAGLVASTGFLVLIIVAAVRFRGRQRVERGAASETPPITVLKPVYGVEPALEANLTSYFEQDYPKYEIIFGARDESDPAIEIARRVSARHPHVPVK